MEAISNASGAILSELVSVVGRVVMTVEVQHLVRDENQDVPESQELLFRIGIHMTKNKITALSLIEEKSE